MVRGAVSKAGTPAAIPFDNLRRRVGPPRAVDFSLRAHVDVTDARSQLCELTANYESELLAGIGHEGPSGPASCLLPEALEPVGRLRTTVTLVRELCDEERERFDLTRILQSVQAR